MLKSSRTYFCLLGDSLAQWNIGLTHNSNYRRLFYGILRFFAWLWWPSHRLSSADGHAGFSFCTPYCVWLPAKTPQSSLPPVPQSSLDTFSKLLKHFKAKPLTQRQRLVAKGFHTLQKLVLGRSQRVRPGLNLPGTLCRMNLARLLSIPHLGRVQLIGLSRRPLGLDVHSSCALPGTQAGAVPVPSAA